MTLDTDEIQDGQDTEWFGSRFQFEDEHDGAYPRRASAKAKERLQRDHIDRAANILQAFHEDLSHKPMPDRDREVDHLIQTKYNTARAELKANDFDFKYRHGDPEKNTWSYEHNFTSRNTSLIVATAHTLLPKDSTIPRIDTPSPRHLRKLSRRSRTKRETVDRFTAQKLEEQLYPIGQRPLAQYIARSCMETSPVFPPALGYSLLESAGTLGRPPRLQGVELHLDTGTSLPEGQSLAVAINRFVGSLKR